MPDAIREACRQRQRGAVPWDFKMRVRKRNLHTPSERKLWRHLKRRLPGEVVLGQWWLDECDYLVDFLIQACDLVVEVDGDSHRGREGADRYRSAEIHARGYEIARVTAEHVMADAERIATQIVFRVQTAAADSALCGVEIPEVAAA